MASLLLDKGAAVDSKDNEEITPLHLGPEPKPPHLLPSILNSKPTTLNALNSPPFTLLTQYIYPKPPNSLPLHEGSESKPLYLLILNSQYSPLLLTQYVHLNPQP